MNLENFCWLYILHDVQLNRETNQNNISQDLQILTPGMQELIFFTLCTIRFKSSVWPLAYHVVLSAGNRPSTNPSKEVVICNQ